MHHSGTPLSLNRTNTSVGRVRLKEAQISGQTQDVALRGTGPRTLVLAVTKETRNGTPRTYPWRLNFRSNRIRRRKVSRRSARTARGLSPATTIAAYPTGKRSERKHRTTKRSAVSATRDQRLRVRSIEESKSRCVRGSCFDAERASARLATRIRLNVHQRKTMTDWPVARDRQHVCWSPSATVTSAALPIPTRFLLPCASTRRSTNFHRNFSLVPIFSLFFINKKIRTHDFP